MLNPPLAHSLLHSLHSSIKQRSEKRVEERQRGRGLINSRRYPDVGGRGNDETRGPECEKPLLRTSPAQPLLKQAHGLKHVASPSAHTAFFSDDKRKASKSALQRHDMLSCASLAQSSAVYLMLHTLVMAMMNSNILCVFCILVGGDLIKQNHFIRSRKLVASWKHCNISHLM